MMITWNRKWCHASVMCWSCDLTMVDHVRTWSINYKILPANHEITTQSCWWNDDEFSKNTLSWPTIFGIYHSHKIKDIMTIVWQWSFQQYDTTMTQHCFEWKKIIVRETETIVRILLLHITVNFHAHNYVLSCFEYAWQPTDSGHESRTHVYVFSPWSRVCWSWWPQSKAWLTMVS